MEPPSSLSMTESDSRAVLVGALTAAAEGVVDDHDDTSSRILDAAFELFSWIGVSGPRWKTWPGGPGSPGSRSTGASPPRRSGRSAGPPRDPALLRPVPSRDIEQAETAADVASSWASSARCRPSANPLIGGLMAVDLNALRPGHDRGRRRTLASVREFVAGQLRREQDAGNVAGDVNVDVVAELMVRVCSSSWSSPATSSISTTKSNCATWPGSSSYRCWERSTEPVRKVGPVIR